MLNQLLTGDTGRTRTLDRRSLRVYDKPATLDERYQTPPVRLELQQIIRTAFDAGGGGKNEASNLTLALRASSGERTFPSLPVGHRAKLYTARSSGHGRA